MNLEKCFRAEDLESIAKVLAETNTGLTGSEIAHILSKCKIRDTDPAMTKWKRLYNAFACSQNERRCGNYVIAFIQKAMSPVRFVSQKQQFGLLQSQLNEVLAFSGVSLTDDGRLKRILAAKTLTEAERRADSLKESLVQRNVHADVLKFCRAELVELNYFHAVLEATKSVANKLREKSGLDSDGAKLAIDALSFGSSGRPLIAINTLKDETQRSEQKGFMNLVIGLFGTFRNPTAHAEKIFWPIEEPDALDILSLVSLVHRKLDKATVYKCL